MSRESTVYPAERGVVEPRRVLVVDSITADVRSMKEATARLRGQAVVDFICGFRALLESDLSRYELVLSAMALDDGTGMDCLAFAQAVAPQIGVIIYAGECSEAVIREAIMSGALDCAERNRTFIEYFDQSVRAGLARLDARVPFDRLRRGLSDALGRMTDELARLQQRMQHLEMLSITDELTGLYNRRFMNAALSDLWRGVRDGRATLACMVIDIDRFKELNDRFGHQSGDAALYVLGEVLRENCRRSDIITRYGGDEFCVLMPEITLEQAREIAVRIEAAFSQSASALLERNFETGLSIGLSVTTLSEPRDGMQLIAHADEAMYAAKREGHAVRFRGPRGVLAA